MSLPGSEAPEIEADKWINSEPLDLSQGTYLLDFWSHTCADCVERIQDIKRLHKSYPGLTAVGIHSPEHGPETVEGVEKAVERHGIDYPVAVDSGSTWEAYGNRYWPRQTVIHEGRIEWRNAGKAGMDELEEKVASILGTGREGIRFSGPGQTVKKYMGYGRGAVFNRQGGFRGEKSFEVPESRFRESTYLGGKWRHEEYFLEAVENSRLFYYTRRQEVAVSVDPDGGIRDIEVLVDGEPVAEEDAGEDLEVEERSYVRVSEPGVYRLLDSGREEFDVTLVPDAGTRFYSLTFR